MNSSPSGRIFISAGDVSGDIHAAGLVSRALRLEPHVSWTGLGGDRMQRAGCRLLIDPDSNPVMGFRRVIARTPHYFKLLARVHHFLKQERPDLAVLVDYPGLNVRIASLAKGLGIPVLYFICPQLWAWAPWRVRRFARVIDRALVIFPFEEAYFSAHGVSTRYVGHPVCDCGASGDDHAAEPAASPDEKLLCLLPGSRRHEAEANLPIMLAAARAIRESDPDCVPVVAHQKKPIIHLAKEMAAKRDIPLRTVEGDMTRTARQARLCLVASGTATLEVAFTETPLIALYKVSPLAGRLSPLLLTVPWFCQVNLVAGAKIVPELLLTRDDPVELTALCRELWNDTQGRRKMEADLAALRRDHFNPGALDRAADEVLALARS